MSTKRSEKWECTEEASVADLELLDIVQKEKACFDFQELNKKYVELKDYTMMDFRPTSELE